METNALRQHVKSLTEALTEWGEEVSIAYTTIKSEEIKKATHIKDLNQDFKEKKSLRPQDYDFYAQFRGGANI